MTTLSPMPEHVHTPPEPRDGHTPDGSPRSPEAVDRSAPSEQFLRLVPRDFARLHLVMSAGREGKIERLLVSERTSAVVVHNIGARLETPVEATIAESATIARLIDDAYGGTSHGPAANEEPAHAVETDVERLVLEADRDVLSTAGKGPVVRLVDAILFEALSKRASDVHVQPLADRVLVRYRVDGVLHTTRQLPARAAEAVVSRVKVMGRMDVAERRVPQDGRAAICIGHGPGARTIDLRISSLPTSYGERVVLRLLDTNAGQELATLDSLGMPRDVRTRYLGLASRAQGVVLLTGPTGSGKTTTLYATLRLLAARRRDERTADGAGDLNVMTIEDPIEYELSTLGVSISQAQVNAKKGVTFASGLRHILRQDPDVIMVGEIRDEATARIAVQASLTGHLVFSTLHTNDAPGAIVRLADLGVEPYLVAGSLSGVMAQRLVRRVHAACAGYGCEACLGSGFLGRTGLFELLVGTTRVRECIERGERHETLLRIAREEGMRTLREEGERLVAEGLTTMAEVARVTLGEDEA